MSEPDARAMRQVQLSNATNFERYTSQSAILARLADHHGYERGLVFGGSYGLEAARLAILMPPARFVTADIDPRVTEIARASFRSPRIEPVLSSWETLEGAGPYDFITANSVLCRHPLPRDVTKLEAYGFAEFEDMLARLVAMLRPGGAMMVCNPSYCVRDTDPSIGLSAVRAPRPLHGFTSLFDRESRLLVHAPQTLAYLTPQYFVAPDADADELFERVTESVFVKGPIDPVVERPAPSLSTDEWETVAAFDPYTDGLMPAPPKDGVPLRYEMRIMHQGDRVPRLVYLRDGEPFDY